MVIIDRRWTIIAKERWGLLGTNWVGCAELAEITIATSIPAPDGGRPAAHSAELRVIYGGTLIDSTWPTATYLRYAIRLPRPLHRGESHEFGISITTPRDQPFNPRYAIQSLRRCDEFDLRIRFGAAERARTVWRIAGLPRGMVDDFADSEALVQPDAVGDIHLRYEHLKLGLVYGKAVQGTLCFPLRPAGQVRRRCVQWRRACPVKVLFATAGQIRARSARGRNSPPDCPCCGKARG